MKTNVITLHRGQRQNLHAPSPQNQQPASFARRFRRWGLMAVALALFCPVLAQAGPSREDSRHDFTPPGARDITILDQNLYVGAEFTPILVLDPTDPNYVRNLLGSVAQVYQAIVASDFPKRAHALAREIAETQPDLVSLQEVSLIRTQVPGDILTGGTTPATDVQLDYLAILLANLNRHGVHYAAVAIVTNLDIELPMPTASPTVFADVRLTDRDVILARVDRSPGQLRLAHPQAGNFQSALPLGSLGTRIQRGWCSVDVTTRGRTFRFINAHLEENTAASIQAVQAQELLAGPANTPLPVILVGDFNSDANGTDGTASYGTLTQSFTDTWSVVHPRNPGLTWGHDPLLADPTVEFIWRFDLVLFRGSQFHATDMWRMSPHFEATPPLWPSDHAGVLAHLRIK
jgi:endonuclease/exonuclease/phosphatase family metal-dependent hydrolase